MGELYERLDFEYSSSRVVSHKVVQALVSVSVTVSLWFYLRDFSIVYSVFPVQQNLIDSRAPTNFDYVTLRWLQFVIVHILTYLYLSGLRKLEPNNKALLKYSRLHLNSSVDALSKKGFFKGTISEDDFLTAMARSDYKIRYQLDLDKDLDGKVNKLFFRFFRLAYK